MRSEKNQSAVSLDEFKLHRPCYSRLIEWEKTFPIFFRGTLGWPKKLYS